MSKTLHPSLNDFDGFSPRLYVVGSRHHVIRISRRGLCFLPVLQDLDMVPDLSYYIQFDCSATTRDNLTPPLLLLLLVYPNALLILFWDGELSR